MFGQILSLYIIAFIGRTVHFNKIYIMSFYTKCIYTYQTGPQVLIIIISLRVAKPPVGCFEFCYCFSLNLLCAGHLKYPMIAVMCTNFRICAAKSILMFFSSTSFGFVLASLS